MRWSVPSLPLALALVAVAVLPGCLDEVHGVAPVVLVTHAFEVSGEGTAPAWASFPCEMVRYEADPPRVTVLLPPGSHMSDVDFVLLQDLGDSWRAANATAPPGGTLVGVAAGSGGGPLPWLGGETRAGLGLASVFRETPQEGRQVNWDGKHALYRGQALEEGVPVTHVETYDVRTEQGGTLRVTETVQVTYLGKVPATVEETRCSSHP